MNVKQAVEQAVDTNDARLAGVVSDCLRFKCGYTYAEQLAFVQTIRPSVTPRQWETLMRAADEEDS